MLLWGFYSHSFEVTVAPTSPIMVSKIQEKKPDVSKCSHCQHIPSDFSLLLIQCTCKHVKQQYFLLYAMISHWVFMFLNGWILNGEGERVFQFEPAHSDLTHSKRGASEASLYESILFSMLCSLGDCFGNKKNISNIQFSITFPVF